MKSQVIETPGRGATRIRVSYQKSDGPPWYDVLLRWDLYNAVTVHFSHEQLKDFHSKLGQLLQDADSAEEEYTTMAERG